MIKLIPYINKFQLSQPRSNGKIKQALLCSLFRARFLDPVGMFFIDLIQFKRK